MKLDIDIEKTLLGLGFEIKKSRLGFEYVDVPTYKVESHNHYVPEEKFNEIISQSEFSDRTIYRRETTRRTNINFIELTDESTAVSLFYELEKIAKDNNPSRELITYLDAFDDDVVTFMTCEDESVFILKVTRDKTRFQLSGDRERREKTLNSFLNYLRGEDSDDHIKGYENIGSVL